MRLEGYGDDGADSARLERLELICGPLGLAGAFDRLEAKLDALIAGLKARGSL